MFDSLSFPFLPVNAGVETYASILKKINVKILNKKKWHITIIHSYWNKLNCILGSLKNRILPFHFHHIILQTIN